MAVIVNFECSKEWIKNKADLDSIYRADLLKSGIIVDLCFILVKYIVSTLQKRLFALANGVTILVLVPDHNENYLTTRKHPENSQSYFSLIKTNLQKHKSVLVWTKVLALSSGSQGVIDVFPSRGTVG